MTDTKALVERVRGGLCPNWPHPGIVGCTYCIHAEDALAALSELEARLGAAEDAMHIALDRAEAAERERDEWKREAELSKWPKDAAQEFHRNKVRVAELEAQREEAERLRLIEHRKMYDECEASQARVAELEEALREMLRLVDRHDRWCGHNKDAPGDGIINSAPEQARAALDKPKVGA